MIRASNLTKRYKGIRVVDRISFEVQEGETLILLGTSGSGKTTSLRMLNRLAEPDEGQVWIQGKDTRTQPKETLRRGIGYVLQNHGLFPHYTVADNIGLVPRLMGWESSRIRQRTLQLLEKLQLPPGLATAYPHELSGGQQQRVGLARALAADPPILLMDEPLGALDPITKALIRQEFRDLDELKRKTIVWVTHDVQEALELGDRICLMDKGHIRQIGKAAELLFRPADAFVKEFFDPQRLQLELSVVSVREAWDYLEDGGSASSPTLAGIPQAGQALRMESSLWEALSALSPEQPQLSVENGQGETKVITFSSAQTALNHLKRLY